VLTVLELLFAERYCDQLSTNRPHLQSNGSKHCISFTGRFRAEGFQALATARYDLRS
jgi:hypothetical protein